jgi:uncharacterized membrane protein YhaH (DUF805 family)
MDKIAAEFQKTLGKFPAMAQNTAIMSARPFEKSFAKAAFYVRTQVPDPLQPRSSERSIFLPHGRIGRVAYAVRWAAILAAYAAMGSVQHATIGSEPNVLVKSLSFVLFTFLVITSIKRLHDLGYGGVAVIFLGPIVPLLLFAPGERGSNTYGDPSPTPFSGNEYLFPLVTLLLAAVSAQAQPTVTVSPVKRSEWNTIVPLEMNLDFAERIKSTIAVWFILDDLGKMVGQGTHWVTGGNLPRSAAFSNP